MKRKKLTLRDLKVTSFVTEIESDKRHTFFAGNGYESYGQELPCKQDPEGDNPDDGGVSIGTLWSFLCVHSNGIGQLCEALE